MMNRNPLPRALQLSWITTAITALILSAGAAQAGPKSAPPDWDGISGRLIIEFEGGTVGAEIARVLELLAQNPGTMPVKPYILEKDDIDSCRMVERSIQVPPQHCGPQVLGALQLFAAAQLGRRSGKTAFRAGDTILVPNIGVESYIFRRAFDPSSVHEQTSANRILGNPEWGKVLREESPRSVKPKDKTTRLAFNGLRWIARIENARAVDRAEVTAFKLIRPNVNVYVERAPRLRSFAPKRFAEVTPSKYFSLCREGLDTAGLTAAYRKYLGFDFDASRTKQCEEPATIPPRVIVIDSAVAKNPDIPLNQTPSQSVLSEASASTNCVPSGTWNRDAHHGTYLSGIVASRGAYSRFVGLSRSAVIQNILWGSTEIQDHALKEEIGAIYDRADGGAKIFLFASNFQGLDEAARNPLLRDTIWAMSGDTLSTSDFANPEIRIRYVALNRFIARDLRPLFIVAAGQRESGSGDELRLTSRLSPQNIGNFRNVIVVTACTDCNSPQAQLWDNANYGAPGAHLVHLAAPGGDTIPGILDESTVGAPAHGGTSAAAAFAAGVAADMMACYPTYYSEDDGRVKERMLLTARPNIRAEDRAKIPAGTINPALALANPRKSWLKIPGPDDPVEIEAFEHWCGSLLELRKADGGDDIARLKFARRVTNIAADVFEVREFERTSDPSGLLDQTMAFYARGPGEADPQERIGAVKMPGRTTCALKLGNVQDLILTAGLNEQRVASCANIQPCFP
jgi:hypothetical protein